jgi:uncharacterized lipoprotein YajG
MKIIQILIVLLFISAACKQKRTGVENNKNMMAIDSISSDKNVLVVKQGKKVRPDESVKDLKELPNIMQYDIDTSVSSKEVKYMKQGEAARPSEEAK